MSSFRIINVMEGEVWFGWPEAGYGPHCIRDEDLDRMEKAIREARKKLAQPGEERGGTHGR